MDVWFDSGSSHMAVAAKRPELSWPVAMYLEGSDQHRGWFQSSLLTSVAVAGRAPYESVLTHGYVVDGDGRKMSKSVGNVIVPQDVIKQYGADIIRLWTASSDYKADIRISPKILKQLAEVYRKSVTPSVTSWATPTISTTKPMQFRSTKCWSLTNGH